MILTIKPERFERLDCFQMLLFNVAKWLGRDVQFAFAESLNFKFLLGEEFSSIGDAMIVTRQFSDDLLQRIHGISLSFTNYMEDQSLNKIMTDLNRGIPVILSLNAFWNPWGTEGYFQNIDSSHYCLVIGYELKSEVFYCIDPVFSLEIKKLSFRLFYLNKGSIGCFHLVDPEELNKDALEDVHKRIYKNILKHNSLEDMINFADKIHSDFDMEVEKKGYMDPWKVPLIEKISSAVAGRKSLYNAVLLLRDKTQSLNYDNILCNMQLLCVNWETTFTLLMKSYYHQEREIYRESVYRKMSAIIRQEEQLISLFLDLCHNKTIESVLEPQIGMPILSYKWMSLELFSYMNNKAFSGGMNGNHANFSGLHDYFILPKEVEEDKCKFIVDSQMLSYDNIQALGQTINFSPVDCKSIRIIAVAEWGHCVEKLDLFYEESIMEEVPFIVSDWVSKYPESTESVIWSGKAMMSPNAPASQVAIYEQVLNCPSHQERLTHIRLPYCPNMHIFSLSI